ncbi:AraC family transcriptional regulator [Pseudovibrio exalbescens]|uniref:HTH araC/xylS-type domain-containing protein n=1 Tax=Pseudovibrio exalbescens TaxID=197461 RepID=A0A1U7JJI2_9HYPH|nr:helix-turn-helix domain-containing protein [Pseudovibrio exalbescens]OKL44879.1 hypothetical protein A3843_06225 [Pseudovibrio exalbescens]
MTVSSQEWTAEWLAALLPLEGENRTRLPQIRLFRHSGRRDFSLSEQEPHLVVFLSDGFEGHMGPVIHRYPALSCCLLSASDTIECRVGQASQAEPAIMAMIRIDARVASELLLEMSQELPLAPDGAALGRSYDMDEPMRHSVGRLMQCLRTERDARFLAPSYYREVLYHLALSQQGAKLKRLFQANEKQQGINRVLRLLKTEYANSNLTVEEMARLACMSTSSFHVGFKAITSKSPLQYIKSIRLQKARALMLSEGLSASQAAYRVGYASASQFSREFKRLFGHSPSQEISRFRRV